MKKCGWVFAHCLVAYFLRHKVIRERFQGVCVPAHCLVAHLRVLRCPGTNANERGSMRTASLQIPWVLRWSGTYPIKYWHMNIASLHMFSVLRWSGTTFEEGSSMSSASSHIRCVLRCSGTSLIQRGMLSYRDIFIHPWTQTRVKCYGQYADQVSPQSTFFNNVFIA